MGGSRRPRLYFLVAAFFLAVFLFSLVGFHDVGLNQPMGSAYLETELLPGLAYTVSRKRGRPLSQHGMDI